MMRQGYIGVLPSIIFIIYAVIMLSLLGLSIYVLYLLIKALKIYIEKNS